LRVGYFTRGLQPASDGNGAGIGVALTLPLFDYGSRRNRIRQAEEGARAQEVRIAATQNDIRQEIAQAQARLVAAEAVLANYRSGVLEQAKRLLDASQLGFREGRVTVVALLEAQRSYVGVQNEYAEALAGVASARAALERASGTVPETLLPTP
jgi:outer membrane protein, heavy metal efflux system